MNSANFREEARKQLSGKWGKAAIISLAYAFIFIVIGIIEGLFPDDMESILSLVTTIIEVPLSLGLIISFVRLFNGEDVKAFDFLPQGFNNFVKSWAITFQIFIKMIVPIILTLVSYIIIAFALVKTASAAIYYSEPSSSSVILLVVGMILFVISTVWSVTQSYYYQLAYIIVSEDPELSAKDAVQKSKDLMEGKRGKLFGLQFSFIGWAILAVFTLGIGYLWLIPYIQFATIAFYKFACGNANVKEVNSTVVEDTENKE